MIVLGLALFVASDLVEVDGLRWIGIVLMIIGAVTSLASLLTDGQAGR